MTKIPKILFSWFHETCSSLTHTHNSLYFQFYAIRLVNKSSVVLPQNHFTQDLYFHPIRQFLCNNLTISSKPLWFHTKISIVVGIVWTMVRETSKVINLYSTKSLQKHVLHHVKVTFLGNNQIVKKQFKK